MTSRTIIALILLILLFPNKPVQQARGAFLPVVQLKISASEVVSADLGYDHASFQSSTQVFDLKVVGGRLTDGKASLSLGRLQALLDKLHTLYPGTAPLLIQRWTDDYPYAWVHLALKDGRYLVINSRSQYGYMLPWNVQVWQGSPDEGGELLNCYFLLHEDFIRAFSSVWKGLTQEEFPRLYGPEEFFWSEDEKTDTLVFYIPQKYDYFRSGASETEIEQAPQGIIAPFVPLLQQNSLLAQLLDSGFTVFDIALDVTVSVEQMHPLGYSGTLALATPDSLDVIATTVDIQLEPDLQVATPLTRKMVEQRLAQRRQYAFLERVIQLFPDVTFLLDTRNVERPKFECPENRDVTGYIDFVVSARLNDHQALPLVFYHLNKLKAWTLDVSLSRRQDGYWEDDLARQILHEWFPSELAELSVSELQALSTHFGIAFQPDISEKRPELLDLLRTALPPETKIHGENPQKEGDYGFASLDGRVVLVEDSTGGAAPAKAIYCGHIRPTWYGPRYNAAAVVAPKERSRSDSRTLLSETGAWTPLRSVPNGDVNWTALGVSTPGFVHLLWTTDTGVYYADGWADGRGWMQAQRLGDDSWNMQVVGSPQGEVHLLWSAGLDPVGTMHVWRNTQGEWQKPEYWEGIGYFQQAILGPQGRLHLGYSASDGIDEEFFYQSWSEQERLSQPENISRRLGNIGNYGMKLQLDSQGSVQAVWGNPMSSSQYIDPLSGEVFDLAGVFYAHRLGDGNWSLPEQLGRFAPFSYVLDFILTDQDEPVVIWQSLEGVVVSVHSSVGWSEPVLLAKVVPPDQPERFGPERWSEATAAVRLGKDYQGEVYAAWATNGENGAVSLAQFDSQSWSTPLTIHRAPAISELNMAIGPDEAVHLTYFVDGSLTYSRVAGDAVATRPLGIVFDYYGLMESSLIVDHAGLVYVLGLPRTPSWTAYIPLAGIPPTPTLPPTATYTLIPLSTMMLFPTRTAMLTQQPSATLPQRVTPGLTSTAPNFATPTGQFSVVLLFLAVLGTVLLIAAIVWRRRL